MTFRKIDFGSDDFRGECELRDKVLRVPLGLSLDNENLDAERREMHFGLFDDRGELLACVIAVVLSPGRVKIRQMAVAAEHQGKGCGRRLIHCLESYLAKCGLVHLSMHARVTAFGFYEKLGYRRMGDAFTEVGIPHLAMEKRLAGLSEVHENDDRRIADGSKMAGKG